MFSIRLVFSGLRRVMARRATARALAAQDQATLAALVQAQQVLLAAQTVQAVGRARKRLRLLPQEAQPLVVLAVLGRRQQLRAQQRQGLTTGRPKSIASSRPTARP